MAVQILHRVQLIPAPLDKVWPFFADPGNLPRITPSDMHFEVLSPSQGDRIYAGELIEYKLRPLPWMRTRWLTEITQVEEGHYFVDEQRRGPYKLWHHQHHFREVQGGVEMTDLVHYLVPFGILGDLANAFFVRRKLEEIFAYRRTVVESTFGVFPGFSGPLTMRAATGPRH
ncbi:MAG TPA: SRPBCC family protein [Puia sp.]|nr:SRPBCC family protein [Puia sp.]